MATKEELEEWGKDKKIAEGTHPNAFANGPFIRSLFKVSQNIDVVGQFLGRLTSITEKINSSLNELQQTIKESNQNSKKLSNKLLWLNVVLTIATVVGAIATAILAFKK